MVIVNLTFRRNKDKKEVGNLSIEIIFQSLYIAPVLFPNNSAVFFIPQTTLKNRLKYVTVWIG